MRDSAQLGSGNLTDEESFCFFFLPIDTNQYDCERKSIGSQRPPDANQMPGSLAGSLSSAPFVRPCGRRTPHLSRISRAAPARNNGRLLVAQLLASEFGFRALQFRALHVLRRCFTQSARSSARGLEKLSELKRVNCLYKRMSSHTWRCLTHARSAIKWRLLDEIAPLDAHTRTSRQSSILRPPESLTRTSRMITTADGHTNGHGQKASLKTRLISILIIIIRLERPARQ